MKVHYPKLYNINMAHLLALNVLLLPKDLTIIFIIYPIFLLICICCTVVLIHINLPSVYVRHKVGIGSIPELHLRKVGIPTLSADSRIVLDNSRIV